MRKNSKIREVKYFFALSRPVFFFGSPAFRFGHDASILQGCWLSFLRRCSASSSLQDANLQVIPTAEPRLALAEAKTKVSSRFGIQRSLSTLQTRIFPRIASVRIFEQSSVLTRCCRASSRSSRPGKDEIPHPRLATTFEALNLPSSGSTPTSMPLMLTRAFLCYRTSQR